MAKVRIYELAKKLGYVNKVFVEELAKEGIEVKSHMSTVDEETADLVMTLFSQQTPAKATPEKKEAAPKAEKEAAPKAEKEPKKTQEKSPAKKKSEPASAKEPPAPQKPKVEEPAAPVKEVPLAPVAEEPERDDRRSRRQKKISLPDALTVKELADKLSIKATEVIKELMKLGQMTTINQMIDNDTAEIVCTEFGFEVEVAKEKYEDVVLAEEIEEEEDNPEDMVFRAPVITVMGHVDHGKTRLLDAIRNANVMDGEAGGITQHIGAYRVTTEKGTAVFLDTPGHEAFTAMRARGAQVTDLIILVVASNEGVMPQTREAVAHAKAAGVPIMVAMNKMDLPDANPDRVKQQLSELELIPDDWGGDTVYSPVSAKEGDGVDDLLDIAILQSEMLELKANPSRSARGIVIEAKLDKGRGPVATVLVQRGTLSVGDNFVAGSWNGKVRALLDDQGRKIKTAGPSTPVEILGISGVPQAGDEFSGVADERTAREIGSRRQQHERLVAMLPMARVSLDTFLEGVKKGIVKELNIILKADVQGSLEALKESLSKLGNDEVAVKILHASAGGITETDVMLAAASAAIIVGFNVRPTPGADETAKREKVDIRLYSVIYHAIEEVKAALEGILDPHIREIVRGHAEVRDTFHIPNVGLISGCYVTDGTIQRGSEVRLIRDSVVVYTGRLSSLRRFKEDVSEVQQSYECGIGIEKFQDVKEGDIIEPFVTEEVARTL
ncbi:MAG: translation initiation factor IF-2 [Nitrospinaceae bacterium]|jgi:translation initiation factor IF-2|nr:translation initiation factor IF-2 [Nitrospinaceae bacterium]MBT3433149.1 translation initiation factor IF-2 [Nitrospinaceae bacterium]MBT3821925.1 translation initiation factor IF-2 [Nitrospinaceae bacterium]MBT4095491.1 translation initiation factor IF-2 [Nitrospinaceae bacterium]MBT4429459.1 translation initiation factor IF-2 [Nitrospinaceae bacterium]